MPADSWQTDEMKAQLTLTVPEGKALIAEAIAAHPAVKAAQNDGTILLKGGTTVSAVAEKLGALPLRISGRISPNGCKSAQVRTGTSHSVLLRNGQVLPLDECFGTAVQELTAGDVAVLGANALDAAGRTAMLLGSPLGGVPGQGMAGIMAQGCTVLIACGIEKLIPNTIDEAIAAAGIRSADWSMGMSCGLVPLSGEVITEQTALARLSGAKVTVIACGGVDGAEGAVTLVADGEAKAVETAVNVVLALKGASLSASPASLQECRKGSAGCALHHSCAWRGAKGDRLEWYKN